MQADELRIPTVAVSVHLAVGPHDTWSERGELYVADDSKRAEPVEALAALLESAVQFVPFRGELVDPLRSGIRLVAKAAIVYVAIPGESQAAGEDLVLYDRQHRVEVLLIQGKRFEGLLLDSSPAAHPRAIDHLNGSAQFIRLWTASECVLIAKAQIATVTEMREP